MCSTSCFRCWTTAGSPTRQGRTVDFKNTILILTSNLGSQFLLDGIGPDGAISEEARDQVQQLLQPVLPARVPEPAGRNRLL